MTEQKKDIIAYSIVVVTVITLLIHMLLQIWFITEDVKHSKNVEKDVRAKALNQIPSEEFLYQNGNYYISVDKLSSYVPDIETKVFGSRSLLDVKDIEEKLNISFYVGENLYGFYETDDSKLYVSVFGKPKRLLTGSISRKTVYMLENKLSGEIEYLKRDIRESLYMPKWARTIYHTTNVVFLIIIVLMIVARLMLLV